MHHALHVLLTGESAGYYQDYRQQPLHHLGRCLTEGFAYQGEVIRLSGRETSGRVLFGFAADGLCILFTKS